MSTTVLRLLGLGQTAVALWMYVIKPLQKKRTQWVDMLEVNWSKVKSEIKIKNDVENVMEIWYLHLSCINFRKNIVSLLLYTYLMLLSSAVTCFMYNLIYSLSLFLLHFVTFWFYQYTNISTSVKWKKHFMWIFHFFSLFIFISFIVSFLKSFLKIIIILLLWLIAWHKMIIIIISCFSGIFMFRVTAIKNPPIAKTVQWTWVSLTRWHCAIMLLWQ